LHFFDLKNIIFGIQRIFKIISEENNNSPDFEKIKKEIVKFLQQVPAITQKYI
jgi:hypothetical protein